MRSQAVIFSIGDEEYALPIEDVQEITSMDMTDIHTIPQAPDYIKGLITIRGEAIPLVNMHLRFGSKVEGKNDYAIIVAINGTIVGLAVDEVKEVRFLENVSPPPPLITTPFISGIENLPDRIIIQLNSARLLQGNEMDSITNLIS